MQFYARSHDTPTIRSPCCVLPTLTRVRVGHELVTAGEWTTPSCVESGVGESPASSAHARPADRARSTTRDSIRFNLIEISIPSASERRFRPGDRAGARAAAADRCSVMPHVEERPTRPAAPAEARVHHPRTAAQKFKTYAQD